MSPPLAITRRRLLPIAALMLLGLAAAGLLPGLLDAFAYLLPPLLLLLALAARRYPGERALLALVARGPGRRTSADVDLVIRKARPRALVPRGGGLIASSLAVRPPPASRAALS